MGIGSACSSGQSGVSTVLVGIEPAVGLVTRVPVRVAHDPGLLDDEVHRLVRVPVDPHRGPLRAHDVLDVADEEGVERIAAVLPVDAPAGRQMVGDDHVVETHAGLQERDALAVSLVHPRDEVADLQEVADGPRVRIRRVWEPERAADESLTVDDDGAVLQPVEVLGSPPGPECVEPSGHGGAVELVVAEHVDDVPEAGRERLQRADERRSSIHVPREDEDVAVDRNGLGERLARLGRHEVEVKVGEDSGTHVMPPSGAHVRRRRPPRA